MNEKHKAAWEVLKEPVRQKIDAMRQKRLELISRGRGSGKTFVPMGYVMTCNAEQAVAIELLKSMDQAQADGIDPLLWKLAR